MRFDLRDRVAVINQLLLCAVIAVLFLAGIITNSLPSPTLFGIAALAIAAGGVAALAVPWTRIPAGWVVVIPLVDIFAIAVLRYADPAAGFGLMWAFPAVWMATLGRVSLIIACTVIPALYWGLIASDARSPVTSATLLLPLVIVAISTTMYVTSRRFAAQRKLLDAQADRLATARSQAIKQELLVTEVLDTVDFGVLRLAADGEIVFENDALAQLHRTLPGLRASRADGVALAEDAKTPLAAEDHPLTRVSRGETLDDVVVWFETPEGRRTALTLTSRRLIDDHGGDGGTVLIARDVTAEREALRARAELVASVSHELRTPLTSILGHLELTLEEEDLSSTARRYTAAALRSSERLLTIVADILAASSPSRASMDSVVHPRPIDVAELVRAATVDLEPVATDRIIGMTVHADDSVPAFADPARIRQVLDNLLGNAIKFNRDGGTIDVTVTSDGILTSIAVRDTGVGILADDRDRVFERFFRSSEDVPGNGLGLSISDDIVRAHGGQMTVDSEPGVGTTFTVLLPATAGPVVGAQEEAMR